MPALNAKGSLHGCPLSWLFQAFDHVSGSRDLCAVHFFRHDFPCFFQLRVIGIFFQSRFQHGDILLQGKLVLQGNIKAVGAPSLPTGVTA